MKLINIIDVMKKLLIVHNFYKDFGGEDSNISEELEYFKKKYEVAFFSEKNNNELNIYDVLSFFVKSNIKTNRKFNDVMNQFNPDIVYIHNTWFKINLGIFDILKKKKVKVILKIHNFRYECGRHFFSKNHLVGKLRCDACGFNKPYFFFLNKYYTESYIKSFFLFLYSVKYFKIIKNYPLTLLAVSSFHKKRLIESGIDGKRIKVFNNPVNFGNYTIKKKERSVVYAGRISTEKGVEELINSWLSSNLLNYTLYIIGEGELKSVLEKKYNDKNIQFLGYLSNEKVLEYISSAQAVITATKLYEGQPRLLCEASSLGTVSIYPSFGGMDEFFPKNYNYSFKQFDYQELTRVVNSLEDNKKYEAAHKDVKNYISIKLDEREIFSKFSQIVDE
jgi:glycosyltransferase involved in cell wall biosynthesis